MLEDFKVVHRKEVKPSKPSRSKKGGDRMGVVIEVIGEFFVSFLLFLWARELLKEYLNRTQKHPRFDTFFFYVVCFGFVSAVVRIMHKFGALSL